MRTRSLILRACGLARLSHCAACSNAPGRTDSGRCALAPSEIADFDTLYSENCSGCHGAEGKGGAAIALANPVYLAISETPLRKSPATMEFPVRPCPPSRKAPAACSPTSRSTQSPREFARAGAKPDVLERRQSSLYSAPSPGDARAERRPSPQNCCVLPRRRRPRRAKGEAPLSDGSFLALITDQSSAPS